MVAVDRSETRSDFSVEDRHVVVVGAGRSGLAAAELLIDRGARVTVSDLRDEADLPVLPASDRVRVECGGHRIDTFTNADLVVLSPGVPPKQAAIDAARHAGVPVIGELELAARWVRGRIVAVTGTKGKSTTTTLTGRMFDAAGFRTLVGGNVGPALSAQVRYSTPDVIHVVEVSSFQLESTDRFHPWIAVLLNLFPDHLDRHHTVEQYADVKARILANQQGSDWVVANADDPHVLALIRRSRAQRLHFALSSPLTDGVLVVDDVIVRRTPVAMVPLVPVSAVRLLGRHLLSDVLAAVTVGVIVGVSADVMARTVAGFEGLEHALELVAEVAGVLFINDSKATNVDAARHAIESVRAGVVVIVGGRFKGGDLRALRDALSSRASAVVAIGEAQPLIREAVADLVTVRDAHSMSDAVRTAFGLTPPGGVVLLAPACASFDMFRDYAERGRRFKEEVARLAEEMQRNREQ